MQSYDKRVVLIKSLGLFLIMLLLAALSGCTPHRIEIMPEVDVNLPGDQHEITAKVTDAEGRPVYNSRVDWILPRSERAVGDIIDTGDDRKTTPNPKKTNTYAKTRTDFDGEAKITITSPQQGKTSIIAVAKGIKNPDAHKDHAVKYWLDLNWQSPDDDINQAGTPHRMKFHIYKGKVPPSMNAEIRDDELRNYRIEWEILSDFRVTDRALDALRESGLAAEIVDALATLKDAEAITGKREFLARLTSQLNRGLKEADKALIWQLTKVPNDQEPDAYFAENGSDLLTTQTPSRGISEVTMRQVWPKEGTNRIRIRLKLPDKLPEGLDQICCPKPNDLLFEKIITKTWQIPRIIVRKTCEPRQVALRGRARFEITLENESPFHVRQVVVSDQIPSGFLFQQASSDDAKIVEKPEDGEVDGKVVWHLPLLPANSPRTFKIDLIAAHLGQYINTVRATTPDTTLLYEDSCQIEVVQSELRAWKFCPPAASADQTIQYFYRINNQGPIAIRNIKATDTLPMGMHHLPLLGQGTRHGAKTLILDVGTLAAKGQQGDRSEGSFLVKADEQFLPGGAGYGGLCRVGERWAQGRRVTNTLEVVGDWLKTDGQIEKINYREQCHTCMQPGLPPALVLEVVDLYDTVETGDTSVYRITVTNQDKTTVKNINVAAWLPVEFVDVKFTKAKVRRLKSIEDLEPYKEPILTQLTNHMPEGMLLQMLDERVRAMLWAILRAELAKVQRMPEHVPQELLHRHLEVSVQEARQKLKQEILPQNGYPPLSLPANQAYERMQDQVEQMMRGMLREMFRDKERYSITYSVDPNVLGYMPVSGLRNHFRKILSATPPLPKNTVPETTQDNLESLWPLDKWPFDSGSMMSKRWLQLDRIKELRQYWRATYYVEAKVPSGTRFKVKDVRFKVVMTADEFNGPVIETESTHLVNNSMPNKP